MTDFPKVSGDLRRLRAEFESERGDLVLEAVPLSEEELRALSDEELQEQIDLLKEQLEHLRLGRNNLIVELSIWDC